MMKLNTLSDSKLARFCTKSVQGQLAACKEVLGCISQGRAPNVEKCLANGGFLKCFIGLASNFCRFSASPQSGLELCGKDAAIARFEAAKKAAISKKLTLAELEPLHVYAWLLTKAQLHEIEEWTASAISTGAK